MAAVTRSASASPSISPFQATVDLNLFPLKSIEDVVNFFRRSLESGDPDIALLSIVAGYVEISLTTGDAAQAAAAAVTASENSFGTSATSALPTPLGLLGTAPSTEIIKGNSVPFPVVTFELISGLYKKFQSILAGVEKPKSTHNRQATRQIIKKVSDVIWNSLIRSSYKDRAHLQNLYSYLSGNKLDCFGVALAVVAGCQLLGYRDVRLAISEDHAWVVFGNKRQETIEITWHGKGSEDKRGQDITAGVESGSWLYLGGAAVVCDKAMEVAAVVCAINISLTANSDCVEIAELQQKLLWLLYDMGHLKKYPMALGTLGELEECNSTHKSISCEQLYYEAICAAREYYRNRHVYPYTFLGHYFNRLSKYRDAFSAWANAADVIRLYTYSCRDDEEIYKELLDIANETIPCVMKAESSGHSARSILRDAEVFANLLRFYDGICQWEEDSLTPILHIGWAKPLVNNITKFDYDIRSQVVIKVPEDTKAEQIPLTKSIEAAAGEAVKGEDKQDNEANKDVQMEGNNNFVKKDEKNLNDGKKTEIPTTLADLTAACGEKILNPDFLLQGGDQPFAEQKQQKGHNNEANGIENNKTSTKQQVQQQQQKNQPEVHIIEAKKEAVDLPIKSPSHLLPFYVEQSKEEDPFEIMLKRPVITLYSQKMKGLKDLLLAEKLNTHAISLQVTAQSVASKKSRSSIDKQSNHIVNSISATNATTTPTTATSTTGQQQQQHHANNSTDGASCGTGSGVTINESIATSRPKRARRE